MLACVHIQELPYTCFLFNQTSLFHLSQIALETSDLIFLFSILHISTVRYYNLGHLQSGYYFFEDESMSLKGLAAASRGCAAPYIQVENKGV